MASVTVFLAVIFAIVLSADSKVIIERRSTCNAPVKNPKSVLPRKGLASSSIKTLVRQAAAPTCVLGDTCQTGDWFTYGYGNIQLPNCTGCATCKGCNDTGVCKKKSQCIKQCIIWGCENYYVCWCAKPWWFNCNNTPIVPWCAL